MRQRKAEVAAARRAAILAQMSAQQKSFIKEHAQLFQETGELWLSFTFPSDIVDIDVSFTRWIAETQGVSGASNITSNFSGSAMDLSEESSAEQSFPVCLGPNYTPVPPSPDVWYCLSCRR